MNSDSPKPEVLREGPWEGTEAMVISTLHQQAAGEHHSIKNIKKHNIPSLQTGTQKSEAHHRGHQHPIHRT